MVTRTLGKYTLLASLFLGLVGVVARPATAQFLCSAGTNDGDECEDDDGCPGGVCIVPLGVCTGGESDGFPCICPSSECVAEPVCSDSPSLGTCAGGVFSDLCCDLADNCFDGSPCTSTQKLCIGGDFVGFPCTTNAQCEGSLCRSTGRFCSGGDFDSFSCVDDEQCTPGGDCISPAPTSTPGGPTATPIAPTATPPVTNTRTPTSPIPSSTPSTPVTPPTAAATVTGTRTVVTPIATSTHTQGFTPVVPTDTPEPTRTPDVGMFATTVTDAPSGTFQLQVDVPSDQLVSFPVEGVFQVFGESFGFTRRRTSRVLNVKDPDGLPFAITAGTTILVIEATPVPQRPGPVTFRNEQGGSCAIASEPHQSGGSLLSLILGLAVLAGGRGFRRFR